MRIISRKYVFLYYKAVFCFVACALFLFTPKFVTADDYPTIDPPVFSHPGGFYQQQFELTLQTVHDGIYHYSVSKAGYETVEGELHVASEEVELTVVMHESGKTAEDKGNFTVNFFVDMTDSPYAPGDEVYISGTMTESNWPEPGSDPDMLMEPLDDDPSIYFISFDLDAGFYAYKYFLNPGWSDGEWSGQPNREVTVYGHTDFHDVWGVIDPDDDPDDPTEPEGLATVTFHITDTGGQPLEDATITFDGSTNTPGDYVFDKVIPEAEIRYTTDGSIPDGNSTLYTGPIAITDRVGDPNEISMTPTNNIGSGHHYNEHWQPPAGEIQKLNSIRAAAFISSNTSGKAATHSYLVHPDGSDRYSMPLISINAHAGAFFDADSGIYVHGNHENFSQRGREWERFVHFEFFETHGSLAFAQNMGARIHGGTSRNRPRKSLRMYARSDYGTTWVNYPLFPQKDIQEYKRFLLRNSGNDWGDAIFRDAFMQSLIEDLRLDIQFSRPAIVFLNGEYWGVHNIRDRLDNRYLQTHYGIDDDNDYTILERDAQFDRGNPDGRQHYLDMISFLQNQGVVSDSNYEELKTRMDVENFADYQIAQIYFMNTDWPGNNIQYWRYYTDEYKPDAPYGLDGRWRWQMFDVDFGFGLNFDYVTGVNEGAAHNTLAFALAPNGPSWPNPPWSTFILRRLVQNEDFRHHFVTRFMDLLNTNFRASTVTQKLDDYRDMYLPEMPEHIHRWRMPHHMNHWESEIEVMRDFALERPGYMRQYLAEEFNLGGTAQVTVQSAIPSQGGIRVNTTEIPGEQHPWTGTYFTGLPIEVEALPNPGYYFSHWEGDGLEDPTDPAVSVELQGNMELVAHYQEALLHYWHFNNLPDGTIENVTADFSATSEATITYPGTGSGYMDRTDGTMLNARHGVAAGYGLRVRNPSNTRMLHLETPSEAYQNLILSFAVHRTTNGARTQSVHYSADGGENWTQAAPAYTVLPQYDIVTVDLRHLPEVNNNPDLQFKILFHGDEAANEEGNNRFDNIVLSGTAIEMSINKSNPPNGYLNDTYPGHYFTASGGTPPYTFSMTGGSLPEGLHLSSNGLLSGAPLESGTFAFFVEVSDQEGATAQHLFVLNIEALSLIHYWHFNNLMDGHVVSAKADHSLTEKTASITYPGSGNGYMDRTDGTLMNAKLNAEAGYALRVRNPSDTRELLFEASTAGYNNIVFSFAVQRTSNGARQQLLQFSADGGNTWTTAGEPYAIGLPFAIKSFDLSAYPEVNNNPDLKLRILFEGSEASGDSGNNRFDNVILQGERFDLSATEPASGHKLQQNQPNPFRQFTVIPFKLETASHVRLDVYNMHGVLVDNILDAHKTAGRHELSFDASSHPAGIYIIRLQSGNFSESKRMILLK